MAASLCLTISPPFVLPGNGVSDPSITEYPLLSGGSAKFQPYSIGPEISPTLLSTLGKTRILATELSPLQQTLFGDKELYFPNFLFGSWNVTATLKRKTFPYGINYLPSISLLEGSPRSRKEEVGNTCNYELHFFSTLANTMENQLVVSLGTGVPKSKIIQDRSYNIISISNAYKQLTPVQSVAWDYRKDPSSLKLDFGTMPLAEDMRPLGPRRAEVFINSRQSEQVDENTFAAAEKSRSIVLVTRDGVVSDTETITEYRRISDNEIEAWNRIAVYLTPNPNSREGILWQQTGGKAVAFYDYEIDMKRILEDFQLPDGSRQSRACVLTPKDVVQCY